jgi:hypothetical protein
MNAPSGEGEPGHYEGRAKEYKSLEFPGILRVILWLFYAPLKEGALIALPPDDQRLTTDF